MKQEEIEALAREMAKGVRTETNLETLTRTLTKTRIETALKAEMTNHCGNNSHDRTGAGSGSSGNGTTAKTVVSKMDHCRSIRPGIATVSLSRSW